jgi:uncharacterized protein YndB with AHSA1/START domain
MSGGASPDPASFDCAIEIAAPPETVYSAFFSREALQEWWGVVTSITGPRPLGIYALEWASTAEADPLIGPWGGAFYGVVIDVRLGREFFLADAYWLPPEGDPIGPMAVHVTCDPTLTGTRLRFQQSGCDDNPRWRRFYRVIGRSWSAALTRLKDTLEHPEPEFLGIGS